MTITKVFPVFEKGSCMDFQLLKIYLTENEAKEAVSLYNKNAEYCEWELDKLPEHPEGHKAFRVSIDGEEIEATCVDILSYPIFIQLCPSVDKFPSGNVIVWCWAIDEDHAKEIATEMIKNHDQH